MPIAVAYSPRVDGPLLVQRGRDTTLALAVYRGGSLATPSAGTFALYNAENASVVTGATTQVGGVASYTVLGSTTTALALGDAWRTEWALTMPDGVVHTFREPGALVRCVPAMAASDADIWRRVPTLSPHQPGVQPLIPGMTLQPYLEEAWREISQRLLRAGRRPWLVVGTSELVTPHVLLTLALVFESLTTRANEAYLEQAKLYRQQYESAWSQVSLTYDVGDDGQADTAPVTAAGSLWTNGRGQTGARWGMPWGR